MTRKTRGSSTSSKLDVLTNDQEARLLSLVHLPLVKSLASCFWRFYLGVESDILFFLWVYQLVGASDWVYSSSSLSSSSTFSLLRTPRSLRSKSDMTLDLHQNQTNSMILFFFFSADSVIWIQSQRAILLRLSYTRKKYLHIHSSSQYTWPTLIIYTTTDTTATLVSRHIIYENRLIFMLSVISTRKKTP